MKKHLKSQMADFRSSRMFAGAAASNEKALPTPKKFPIPLDPNTDPRHNLIFVGP
jgi:hypothetical protein